METRVTFFNVDSQRAEPRSRGTIRIDESGKKGNPQKLVLKKICDVLFYLGSGNFWYEDRNLTNTQQNVYNIYVIIMNVYLFGNSINEFLANLRSDLTSKEKNDLTQFTIAHSHVAVKIIMLHLMKPRIKILFKRFFEDMREFARLDLDVESVKKAKKYSAMILVSVYATVVTALLDGIKMHLIQGIPIRTEVVFYPNSSQSGLLINILRILVELHWWYLVAVFVCIDCMCVCCLVFTAFKFRTLKMYFEGLKQKSLENPETNLEVLEAQYRKDFERGISYHKEILWCARHVQYALGNLYSIQIAESIGLLVMCLLKLVREERNITFLFANLSFILCLVILTGAYMLSAGDIIDEAQKVPTAIFHSGWELTKMSKKIRPLVIVTLIRSHVPVFMTAFGIFILSYENFIAVLHHSYSFFAVMY